MGSHGEDSFMHYKDYASAEFKEDDEGGIQTNYGLITAREAQLKFDFGNLPDSQMLLDTHGPRENDWEFLNREQGTDHLHESNAVENCSLQSSTGLILCSPETEPLISLSSCSVSADATHHSEGNIRFLSKFQNETAGFYPLSSCSLQADISDNTLTEKSARPAICDMDICSEKKTSTEFLPSTSDNMTLGTFEASCSPGRVYQGPRSGVDPVAHPEKSALFPISNSDVSFENTSNIQSNAKMKHHSEREGCTETVDVMISNSATLIGGQERHSLTVSEVVFDDTVQEIQPKLGNSLKTSVSIDNTCECSARSEEAINSDCTLPSYMHPSRSSIEACPDTCGNERQDFEKEGVGVASPLCQKTGTKGTEGILACSFLDNDISARAHHKGESLDPGSSEQFFEAVNTSNGDNVSQNTMYENGTSSIKLEQSCNDSTVCLLYDTSEFSMEVCPEPGGIESGSIMDDKSDGRTDELDQSTEVCQEGRVERCSIIDNQVPDEDLKIDDNPGGFEDTDSTKILMRSVTDGNTGYLASKFSMELCREEGIEEDCSVVGKKINDHNRDSKSGLVEDSLAEDPKIMTQSLTDVNCTAQINIQICHEEEIDVADNYEKHDEKWNRDVSCLIVEDNVEQKIKENTLRETLTEHPMEACQEHGKNDDSDINDKMPEDESYRNVNPGRLEDYVDQKIMVHSKPEVNDIIDEDQAPESHTDRCQKHIKNENCSITDDYSHRVELNRNDNSGDQKIMTDIQPEELCRNVNPGRPEDSADQNIMVHSETEVNDIINEGQSPKSTIELNIVKHSENKNCRSTDDHIHSMELNRDDNSGDQKIVTDIETVGNERAGEAEICENHSKHYLQNVFEDTSGDPSLVMENCSSSTIFEHPSLGVNVMGVAERPNLFHLDKNVNNCRDLFNDSASFEFYGKSSASETTEVDKVEQEKSFSTIQDESEISNQHKSEIPDVGKENGMDHTSICYSSDALQQETNENKQDNFPTTSTEDQKNCSVLIKQCTVMAVDAVVENNDTQKNDVVVTMMQTCSSLEESPKLSPRRSVPEAMRHYGSSDSPMFNEMIIHQAPTEKVPVTPKNDTSLDQHGFSLSRGGPNSPVMQNVFSSNTPKSIRVVLNGEPSKEKDDVMLTKDEVDLVRPSSCKIQEVIDKECTFTRHDSDYVHRIAEYDWSSVANSLVGMNDKISKGNIKDDSDVDMFDKEKPENLLPILHSAIDSVEDTVLLENQNDATCQATVVICNDGTSQENDPKEGCYKIKEDCTVTEEQTHELDISVPIKSKDHEEFHNVQKASVSMSTNGDFREENIDNSVMSSFENARDNGQIANINSDGLLENERICYNTEVGAENGNVCKVGLNNHNTEADFCLQISQRMAKTIGAGSTEANADSQMLSNEHLVIENEYFFKTSLSHSHEDQDEGCNKDDGMEFENAGHVDEHPAVKLPENHELNDANATDPTEKCEDTSGEVKSLPKFQEHPEVKKEVFVGSVETEDSSADQENTSMRIEGDGYTEDTSYMTEEDENRQHLVEPADQTLSSPSVQDEENILTSMETKEEDDSNHEECTIVKALCNDQSFGEEICLSDTVPVNEPEACQEVSVDTISHADIAEKIECVMHKVNEPPKECSDDSYKTEEDENRQPAVDKENVLKSIETKEDDRNHEDCKIVKALCNDQSFGKEICLSDQVPEDKPEACQEISVDTISPAEMAEKIENVLHKVSGFPKECSGDSYMTQEDENCQTTEETLSLPSVQDKENTMVLLPVDKENVLKSIEIKEDDRNHEDCKIVKASCNDKPVHSSDADVHWDKENTLTCTIDIGKDAGASTVHGETQHSAVDTAETISSADKAEQNENCQFSTGELPNVVSPSASKISNPSDTDVHWDKENTLTFKTEIVKDAGASTVQNEAQHSAVLTVETIIPVDMAEQNEICQFSICELPNVVSPSASKINNSSDTEIHANKDFDVDLDKQNALTGTKQDEAYQEVTIDTINLADMVEMNDNVPFSVGELPNVVMDKPSNREIALTDTTNTAKDTRTDREQDETRQEAVTGQGGSSQNVTVDAIAEAEWMQNKACQKATVDSENAGTISDNKTQSCVEVCLLADTQNRLSAIDSTRNSSDNIEDSSVSRTSINDTTGVISVPNEICSTEKAGEDLQKQNHEEPNNGASEGQIMCLESTPICSDSSTIVQSSVSDEDGPGCPPNLESSPKNSPFTDAQQEQLRCQILVYGSIIQGAAPDEKLMVAAFLSSDGVSGEIESRAIWEKSWQGAVERIRSKAITTRAKRHESETNILEGPRKTTNVPSSSSLVSNEQKEKSGSFDDLSKDVEGGADIVLDRPRKRSKVFTDVSESPSKVNDFNSEVDHKITAPFHENDSNTPESLALVVCENQMIALSTECTPASVTEIATSPRSYEDWVNRATDFQSLIRELEKAKASADEASSKANLTVKETESVWSHIKSLNVAGQISDAEKRLVSSNIVMTTAASVARAAAAAAQVAYEACLFAKRLREGDVLTSDELNCPEPVKCLEYKSEADATQDDKEKMNSSSISSAHIQTMSALRDAAGLASNAISQVGLVLQMGNIFPFTLETLLKDGPEHVRNMLSCNSSIPMGDELGRETMLIPQSRSEDTEKELSIVEEPEKIAGVVALSDNEIPKDTECDEDVTADIQIPITKGHAVSPNLSNLVKGSLVEVRSDEDGLNGVWFSGKVQTVEGDKILVVYDHLLSDDGIKPLEEWVIMETLPSMVPKLRLAHPVQSVDLELIKKRRRSALCNHSYFIGDRVDAWISDGWWEGEIMDIYEDDGKVKVFFPGDGDTQVISISNLRAALVWDQNEWVLWKDINDERETICDIKFRKKSDTPAAKRQRVEKLQVININLSNQRASSTERTQSTDSGDSVSNKSDVHRAQGPKAVGAPKSSSKKRKLVEVTKQDISNNVLKTVNLKKLEDRGTSGAVDSRRYSSESSKSDGVPGKKLVYSNPKTKTEKAEGSLFLAQTKSSAARLHKERSVQSSTQIPTTRKEALVTRSINVNLIGKKVASVAKLNQGGSGSQSKPTSPQKMGGSDGREETKLKERQTVNAAFRGGESRIPMNRAKRELAQPRSRIPIPSSDGAERRYPGSGPAQRVAVEKHEAQHPAVDASELRRTSRNIKPTSKLLEGFQTAPVVRSNSFNRSSTQKISHLRAPSPHK